MSYKHGSSRRYQPPPTRQLNLEMEGVSVLNRETYHRVIWERRIMFTATALCVFCILLFVIAVATASWAIFDVYDERHNVTVCLHVGIWGEWRIESDPATKEVRRTFWIKHFPQPPPDVSRLGDLDLLHYYRTQAVFGVVGLILMLLGNGFALYSFNHHRYMYKRLTFGLLAFVAMCVLVVVEVLIHSVQEWRSFSAAKDKKHATGSSSSSSSTPSNLYLHGMSYGYSTYLSWIVFAVYVAAAIIFLIGGRKQKGSRAATAEFEEEDRPVNLGR